MKRNNIHNKLTFFIPALFSILILSPHIALFIYACFSGNGEILKSAPFAWFIIFYISDEYISIPLIAIAIGGLLSFVLSLIHIVKFKTEKYSYMFSPLIITLISVGMLIFQIIYMIVSYTHYQE